MEYCKYIIPCNELQNAINCYTIDIHSKTSKQKCNTIVTIGTYKKCRICNDIYYIIKQTMSRNKTSYLAPFYQSPQYEDLVNSAIIFAKPNLTLGM